MEIKQVELLILGAGWTSNFLIPLLEKQKVSFAATSTSGREGTIKFIFDPTSEDPEPYKALPAADTVLVVFPIQGEGGSRRLVDLYKQAHPTASHNRYVQLGSTGIFQIPDQPVWLDRHSAYDKANIRAIAEDELRALGGCVLQLSGLWGGERQPRESFVQRVAPTKEKLSEKKSLHMIHGNDVARAILAIHNHFTPGERWMLTDMFVYDWWVLAMGWGQGKTDYDQDAKGDHPRWVRELMTETGVKALPRSMDELGRCYDSREFWEKFGIAPVRARM